MSTPKDLRDGFATRLAGVPTDTATVFRSYMPKAPDRVLAVTWYPVPTPNTHGVQVRCRGAAGVTTSAEDLADLVVKELHGLHDLTMGDTQVSLITYMSGARIGFDANSRDEVALNFYVTTDDPATSLVDVNDD